MPENNMVLIVKGSKENLSLRDRRGSYDKISQRTAMEGKTNYSVYHYQAQLTAKLSSSLHR